MTTRSGPPQVGQKATTGSGGETSRLAIDGLCPHDQQAAGVERDGPAGMQKAEVTDLHKAVGQDMLEESADTLDGIEAGKSWGCTARLTGGVGHGALRERDETASGDRHFADVRGEVLQGGGGVGSGLAVDVPGDSPDPWVDLFQEAGFEHFLLPHGAGDGGEGFDRDNAGGSGGPPGRAVLGQAAARDEGMDVEVGRELAAPGRQNPGQTRERCPDERLVFGEPLEGLRRGGEQGVVGEAVRRADKRAQGCRDGESDEEGRSGQLLLQVVGYPLLGVMLLALWTVSIPAGMINAVGLATAWALREARAVVSAAAMADGAADLAGRGGGERSRDSGAQAVQISRRGVMAGALA